MDDRAPADGRGGELHYSRFVLDEDAGALATVSRLTARNGLVCFSATAGGGGTGRGASAVAPPATSLVRLGGLAGGGASPPTPWRPRRGGGTSAAGGCCPPRARQSGTGGPWRGR